MGLFADGISVNDSPEGNGALLFILLNLVLLMSYKCNTGKLVCGAAKVLFFPHGLTNIAPSAPLLLFLFCFLSRDQKSSLPFVPPLSYGYTLV